MFGVMAGAKDLPRLQREHTWSMGGGMKRVFQMSGLVVGMASIGRATAQPFAALAARAIGVNRWIREVPGVERVHPTTELAAVVGQADAIINTLPQANDTTGLISAVVLANLKPGAIFVSTGEAPVSPLRLCGMAASRSRRSTCSPSALARLQPAVGPGERARVAPHRRLNPAEDEIIARMFADNARRPLDGQELVDHIDRVNLY